MNICRMDGSREGKKEGTNEQESKDSIRNKIPIHEALLIRSRLSSDAAFTARLLQRWNEAFQGC